MFLYERAPTLDLHGLDKDYAVIKTKEFLNDQVIMREKRLVIVHGKGLGILKKAVHEVLSKDKRVEKYYVDFFNSGCTLVDLKK